MNTNWGKNMSTEKKCFIVCIFIASLLLLATCVTFAKTYMSHADRWSSKKNPTSNTAHTTYNILSQNLSSVSITPAIQTEKANTLINLATTHTPDIICLQNASCDIVNSIDTSFTSANYNKVLFYADATNSNSTPIYYDVNKFNLVNSGYYWLSDTPNVSSNTWNEDKSYIVTWVILKDITNDKTFGIANIELSKNVDAQTKSLHYITENCRNTFNGIECILCGTFNCTTNDESFSIVDSKYSNLSVISNKLFNIGPTSTNNTPKYNDDYVYDYVFGSENIKCDRYAVLKDHVTQTNGLTNYGVMSNIYF